MDNPVVKIITVSELLTNAKLSIPVYQRPYKWTAVNVLQLINDILLYQHSAAYRLGSVIVHREGNKLKIVDGQQRTITLLLIATAILNTAENSVKAPVEKLVTSHTEKKLVSFSFSNPISKANIYENYKTICAAISGFNTHTVNFILYHCQVVLIELEDISEAFQFFDSQNARGKDLAPHDLLKAFHLREFPQDDLAAQKAVVDEWENTDSQLLDALFANYLYRIKGWSKGTSSRYFTKANIEMFKGISLSAHDKFPYARQITMLHIFIDDLNKNPMQKYLGEVPFPFQLDGQIINGKRFFEMISHYIKIHRFITQDLRNRNLSHKAAKILNTLDTYNKRYRTGDMHIRTLFNCAVMYYYDKFGEINLSEAIEKIFMWAYTCRINNHSIRFASVDKRATQTSLFRSLYEARTPGYITLPPDVINQTDLIEKLEKL